MLPSLKMDSPTPAIAVVDENNHEKKEASSRRSNSVHIDTVLFKKSAEEICQENIAYCSRYSLTQVGVFFSVAVIIVFVKVLTPHSQTRRPA